jgi:hypothetical protein
MAIASLSELKTYLGITDSDSDAKLTIILDGVCSAVEQYLNRTYTERTITGERHEGGTVAVIVKHYPITTITQIVDKTDDSVVTATLYEADLATGMIYLVSNDNWGVGTRRWSVDYKVLETVPNGVKQAALTWCSNIWNNNSGMQSESIGDYSYTAGGVVQLPAMIAEMLKPFKRLTI